MLLPATRTAILNSARFATPSGQSRLALYEGSLQLLRQAPLQGTGLSNFGEAFERVRPAEYTEKLIYPHNIALNFWLETGLVGLLAILWIAFTIIRAFLTRPRSLPRPDQRPQQAAIVGLTAALLTMLIHGLVDVPYFKNDLAMLTWLILAAFAFYTAKQAQSA